MSSFSSAIQLISVPDTDSDDLAVIEPFAIISAYRNSYSEEENAERSQELADAIKEEGLKPIQIEGAWEHFENGSNVPTLIPEHLFLVHTSKTVDPEEFLQQMQKLRMEFEQDSFLYSDGSVLRLVREEFSSEIGTKLNLKQVEDTYALVRNQQDKFVFSSAHLEAKNVLSILAEIVARIDGEEHVTAIDAHPPVDFKEKPALVEKAVRVPQEYQKLFDKATEMANVPADWAKNAAVLQIAQNESSWNHEAKNPASSAFGLFQLLKSTWNALVPEAEYGTEDPLWQIVGGLRYIKKRYKTPERALAFWNATRYRNAELAPEDLRKKAAYWISKGFMGY